MWRPTAQLVLFSYPVSKQTDADRQTNENIIFLAEVKKTSPTIAQHLHDRNGDLSVGGNTRCATNLSASGAVQENDVITMTCSITYSGNWAPVMRWFNSVSGVNYRPTSANQTSSRLTLTASTGLHGSKVACLTNFTQPSSPLQTSATNIPSYTHIWTSPTLDVQCKL